jgi:hypothetical protein
MTDCQIKEKRYDFFPVSSKNIKHGNTNTEKDTHTHTNTCTEHAHYLWEH